METSRWTPLRIALAIAALGVVMYLVWDAYDHQALLAWIRGLRPLPFLIALAVLPAIGVPATWLFIIAGASFGIPLGIVEPVECRSCPHDPRASILRLSALDLSLPDENQSGKAVRMPMHMPARNALL